jgi:hypothetical protein
MTEAAYLEARRRRDLLLAGGSARPKAIAVTQMSRSRLGADSEGILVLVAEGDLVLTSVSDPTVLRCFWLLLYSGEFGPATLALTGTLRVAVTLVGSERWCTYREGLVVFVAEGDLLLAAGAPMLLFVSTLLGLAVSGMAYVVGGFADVGHLTDMAGFTDDPAAIGRLTNVVRARSQRLLARGGRGGLLGLPNCRFANNRRFGRRATSRTRHSSLEGRPLLLRARSWRVVVVGPATEDSTFAGSGHTGYRQK